jgi:hydroxymethylglutaryl-CoA lyase
MKLPQSVTVVDVAARDGLQSFNRWVETDKKVAMVDRLTAARFPVIEVTNFAHPRMIPNLRDAEEVMERIQRAPGIIYRAQAPNAKGAQRAVVTAPDEVLGLITASEYYNLKNQNMTIQRGIDSVLETFAVVDSAGIPFVVAIGMAYWCPFEGRIDEARVVGIVERLHERGIKSFYLAGSIGMEDPVHVGRLMERVLSLGPTIDVGFHAHNLAGNASANILAALDAGASRIEGSICGIGGGVVRPDTLGSLGNFPTEDIVHMLNEMGVATGVTTEAALTAARDIAQMLDITPDSYLSRSGTRDDVMALARQR